MSDALLAGEWVRAIYVAAFGLSALVCFGGIGRIDRMEHDDTRRGLRWLLLTSGGWAAAHVGYLLAPIAAVQYALFVGGLVLGIAAVGAWLYLCSAYTGRSLHRNRTVRRLTVGVFGVIVAMKLTNPIHGAYFEAEPVAEPFAYLAISHEPLHWVVLAFAYALSLVGFFMLFELFVQVNSDTRPLFALVGLTGLPAVLDIAGVVSPSLINITYSPLGVAVFVVGVFYVSLEQFQVVRAVGEGDNPVIVLDDDGRIRDYNAQASDLFSSLRGAIGEDIEDVLPTVNDVLGTPTPLLETHVGGVTRYFNVSASTFLTNRSRTGRTIILTDITHREQYRKKLEQQNEQLEQFASIVSHDLRNPLSVAQGWTELAVEEDDTSVLPRVIEAHDRMYEIIEEILTLAREGHSIDEIEGMALGDIARRSWEMITAGDASLTVEDTEFPVEADPERLQQLFENLFRNSIEHGSTSSRSQTGDAIEHGGRDVTVTVGSLPDRPGFFIEDDGPGIPESDRDEVFTPGFSTAENGTGFGLAIVAEIVKAHGWEIDAVEARSGGARFEITVSEEGAN